MSASNRLALLRCRDGTRQGDEFSTATSGRDECSRTADSGHDAACVLPNRPRAHSGLLWSPTAHSGPAHATGSWRPLFAIGESMWCGWPFPTARASGSLVTVTTTRPPAVPALPIRPSFRDLADLDPVAAPMERE